MNRAIERLSNAIAFLDMVRETPAHDRPEGVMRDALHDLEEAAREVAALATPEQKFVEHNGAIAS